MNNHLEPNELDELEQLLSELTSEDLDLVELPTGLWEGIEAEALSPVSQPAKPEMFVYDQEAAASVDVRSSNVVEFAPKRRSVMPFLAIAAASIAVLGAIGVLITNNNTEPAILASAELAYDPDNFDVLGETSEATAVLVDDSDGNQIIKIDESNLPDPSSTESADLEIWLIQPDEAGQPADLVSLGLVDPDNPGEFAVPDGFDADIYFVVDISIEPRDGDETHSGRSILRGPLSEV